MAKVTGAAIALAIASAIFLALPLFLPLLFPLAWFGLMPFLRSLQYVGWPFAIVLSAIFGFVFHGLANYWLVPTIVNLASFVEASPEAMRFWAIAAFIGLLLGKGLFASLFGITAWVILQRRSDFFAALGIGAGWLLSEWLRSLGTLGYPWALLASTQVACLPIVQSVSWIGSYGLGMVIVFVNGLLFFGWQKRQLRYFVAPTLLLIAMLVLGWLDMARIQRLMLTAPHLTVAVVQGNFGMGRWRPDVTESELKQILQTHLKLSEQAVRKGAQVIVWSETAIPWALRTDGRWGYGASDLVNFAQRHQVALLVGATEQQNDKSYNACFAFSPSPSSPSHLPLVTRHFAGVYHKVRLVPFGEHVPYRETLPLLAKLLPERLTEETTPGKEIKQIVVRTRSHTLIAAVVICFESLFPFHLRALVDTPKKHLMPANLIVIITNDSWYGYGLAPYHHARIAILRGVEERRSIARSAGTGISMIVLPTGKVVWQAKWNKRAVLIAPVPLLTGLSPYHRLGDLPFVGVALLLLALAWRRR